MSIALRRLRLPLSCSRVYPAALASRRHLSSSVVKLNATSSAATDPSPVPSFFTPKEGDKKPFFITTPIFYVNASPHIGHLHSVVLTDVFARFARLRHPDREVVFATGTDEHGLKVQQAAAKGGMSEQEFCDQVSKRFRDLAELANSSHTDFIRTSEPRHYAAVEAFWAKLVESGAIYKGSHSGWYSVSDECFYSETQVEKSGDIMIATETGSEVTWQEEENWKFRLSNYEGALKKWLESPETVHPPAYHESILQQTSNMQDLSVSRPSSRVKWGVPVPGDDSQTIYVWVDALINYLTVVGYPGSHAAWPVDMHIVGKDIVRFHALHWPALLAAAGEAMPKRVLAHAHWTMGKAKMSKSRGNVADPIAAIGKYGVDGVRWYLMRQGGSLSADADYSETELAASYARLTDQIGNLIGRISSPALVKRIKTWDKAMSVPELDAALDIRDTFESRFENYELTRAAAGILDMIAEANRYISSEAPWTKEDGTVSIVYAYTALRIAAILAQPIMPSKAVELLDRLGVPPTERSWEHAIWTGEIDAAEMARRLVAGREKFQGTTLFPRILEEGDRAEKSTRHKVGKK